MATGQLGGVVQHLRRAVLLRDGAGLTDGQLLEDYISRRDEAALAALVRRHGPMVWGVCRRVLGNHHDAEDAFQATFLVLVRRAASIASRELLANWLYGVAHQTAIKARATVAKRKVRERQVTEMPEPAAVEQDLWNDLQPLLDQELSRLPEVYRVIIVLCDLEGKTRKEAAGHLGLPEGTVGSRLARARVLLAKRLTDRGVTLSSGALAAVLAQNAASAGVPTSVVSSTLGTASLFAAGQTAAGVISPTVAALTEGVLKAMLMNKLRAVIAAVLVLGFLVTGATVLTFRTAAAQGDKPPIAKTSPSPIELEKKKSDPFLDETPKEDGRKKPAAKHDFTNLQRLATALENFNFPENTATTITVWCQGGGKGTSAQVTDAKTLDVAAACHLIVDGHDDKKGLDLENVAVVSADGTTIRFVNVKEKFAANRPFGFNVNRGDLVIVLQLRKD